jgi:uncharacterized Zn-binding protein involved in type VI secretion
MGKPAARVNDPVAHLLPPVLSPGPGSPNVFISYFPAWRGVGGAAAAAIQAAKAISDATIKAAEAATAAATGPGLPVAKAAEQAAKASAATSMGTTISGAAGAADIHVCATPLPLPPHGPGVVVDGSPTVLINGLPACRQGDTIVEAVGPSNKIAMGCMSVLIGDAPSTGQKWTADEIKQEWQKTERGKQILQSLPKSTQFKAYKKSPGESRNAYYRPDAIYIPDEYTSVEAAPTAAHEAVHADQVQNHKRPVDANDKIEMEVEAKNAGLDVYEQMNRPPTPYNYKAEADFRKSNQDAYNEAVRKLYRKNYNIK